MIKSDWEGGPKGRHRPQCEGQLYGHLTTVALVQHVTFPEAHFLTYRTGRTVQQLHCHGCGDRRWLLIFLDLPPHEEVPVHTEPERGKFPHFMTEKLRNKVLALTSSLCQLPHLAGLSSL